MSASSVILSIASVLFSYSQDCWWLFRGDGWQCSQPSPPNPLPSPGSVPGALAVPHGEAGALLLKDLREKICAITKPEIRSGLPCFTQQPQSRGKRGKGKAICWIRAKLPGVSRMSPHHFHAHGLRTPFASPFCPALGPISFHPTTPHSRVGICSPLTFFILFLYLF